MRHKIPCKKYRLPGLICLLFTLFLPATLMLSFAGDVENQDQALFWSIRKGGEPAGYILGTIHSEDPRVLDFSENFLLKLKDNDVFAMELVPDLPTLARLTEYMHYPPGQTLESVIGVDRYNSLVSAMSSYKVPAEFISRMKPWAAMLTLSTPPPETGYFMDLSLSLRASGNGLKVVGLETLEQQLSFLQNMPLAMQLSLLDQAVADYGRVNEVHAEMVSVYLENDLPGLQTLSVEQLQTAGEEAGEYFLNLGINDRNLHMVESLLPELENSRVFVAVGALHLPGEQGLLNILRRHGFDLEAMDPPFREDPVTMGQ